MKPLNYHGNERIFSKSWEGYHGRGYFNEDSNQFDKILGKKCEGFKNTEKKIENFNFNFKKVIFSIVKAINPA